MTLTEYLVDYASEETKKHGFELIEKELEKIPKEKVREIARKNIEDIKHPTAGISGSNLRKEDTIMGLNDKVSAERVHIASSACETPESPAW